MRSALPINRTPHLLDTVSLEKKWVERLFKQTALLKKQVLLGKKRRNDLRGHDVGLLFYENSTRTRASFHIAASRLGADPITIEIAFSSVQKGESLEDTVMTMEAIGCHFLVLRHGEPLSAERAAMVARHAHVINAGDGAHEHPTQALLDTFTIYEKKKKLEDLSILFLGDILYSRVARSNIILLNKLGNSQLLVCGPPSLLAPQQELDSLKVQYVPNLRQALAQADVIHVLRVQLERHAEKLAMTPGSYREAYGLTRRRLKEFCKEDVLIFHPGPMNVGVEIDREAADGPNSCVLDQVQNGVAVRMALLLALHQDCR